VRGDEVAAWALGGSFDRWREALKEVKRTELGMTTREIESEKRRRG
jgi:hypothetical protein